VQLLQALEAAGDKQRDPVVPHAELARRVRGVLERREQLKDLPLVLLAIQAQVDAADGVLDRGGSMEPEQGRSSTKGCIDRSDVLIGRWATVTVPMICLIAWPYPVECGRGHPWSPGHVIVSYVSCLCRAEEGISGYTVVRCTVGDCPLGLVQPAAFPARRAIFPRY
jgi:hypothetical protein